jgi:hypothetical protein
MALLVAAGTAIAVTGCVIPPPLDIDEGDAGGNFRPNIVAAGPAPDFSGASIVLDRQGEERRLSLTIEDHDLGDTQYIKLFVDYDPAAPTPPLGDCIAQTTDTLQRVADCPVRSLCNAVADGDQNLHDLEALVADRPFYKDNEVPEGEPLYRALPPDGLTDSRHWAMTCNATGGAR